MNRINPAIDHEAAPNAETVAAMREAREIAESRTTQTVALDTDKLEQLLQARASIGPRITPTDVEEEIASEVFFTAADGWAGAQDSGFLQDSPAALDLLTFCVLVLRNGFTVTGTSACASPENFDAEIGRQFARRDAVRQVWPLLGFRLRDQLACKEMVARPYGGTSET